MENPLIPNTQILSNRFFNKENIQEHLNIPPNIISQIQFLLNRTDELKTVLKEIDETLNKINDELIKKMSSEI
jgi:outer membrane protein assembly factor BamA